MDKIKYGYVFHDWGLFDIIEILSVEELDNDTPFETKFTKMVFKKSEWALIRTVGNMPYPIVNKSILSNGAELKIGFFPKHHIFDSREEAEKYGMEDGRLTFF